MHPYLSADIAAAHVADLLREAAATCCRALTSRHPVLDRVRKIARQATAALHRDRRAAPACCPA